MARVTGVPMNFLLNRGQQIKVVSQLLRKSKEKGFILPTNRSKQSDEKGFEGAYVLDPVVGYYK
jgi:DNA polymerase delta subunit 1